MKPYVHLTVAVLSAVAVSSCASADMMNDSRSSMHEAVTSAEVENDRHSDACGRADSMPGMLAELDIHNMNMAPLMTRMDDTLGGMTHCSGNLDTLSGTVTQMRTAMSDHDQQMRRTETLDAARAICSAHIGSMADMMHGMMTDLAGMSCMRMHP